MINIRNTDQIHLQKIGFWSLFALKRRYDYLLTVDYLLKLLRSRHSNTLCIAAFSPLVTIDVYNITEHLY